MHTFLLYIFYKLNGISKNEMARQSEKDIAEVWKAHPFTAASLQAK